MSGNLKEMAKRAKEEYETQPKDDLNDDIVKDILESNDLEEFEVEEDESVINGDDFDDDDEPVVIGITPASDDDDLDLELDNEEDFVITDEELREEMPDLDDVTFEQMSDKVRNEIYNYRKELIIKSGLTIEEANAAAKARVSKRGKEENDVYLKENPNMAIVEIDKTNVDKVEFTPEEREKLVKVKSIKLKVVEDVDLKTINIERIDKRHKAAALQSLDTNLAQYSVPLPLMSDFCKFKGSQIIQLIQAIRYDDASLDEIISKKASLIYNQLSGGANLQKFDENGKVIMSYQDFINKFMFHDIDMALYGILVASSMESIESTLTCGSCDTPFQWKYNLKQLLDLSDLSDEFKDKFDDILAHKSNTQYLQELYKENHKSIRVKSPITKNMYDLDYPTIARAINLYQVIDQKDETMLYLSAFALFINKMYVYNKKKDSYIPIEEDEYRSLMEVLQTIPQEEIDIIQTFLSPYLYKAKFTLKSKCQACGHNMVNELSIDDLVFLRARDSSTEIQ